MSPGLLPSVKDCLIHDKVMGSDHCPVSLHFNFSDAIVAVEESKHSI